ncbi:MAG TPA: alpha/beta hydrolase [Acidimicrobiales bacterium]|nr:alpha/beta hydrolase [Acidimicrobiales bacterium]
MSARTPRLPPGGPVRLERRGRTWVYDTGPPDGAGAPPVVLLHGWTSSAALNWYRCFEPLASRHRVVALDHRGHARGIRSRRPFRLEDCADDAAALIRELGLGPSIIAGYSMGGPVAQLLWKRHRDLVEGLVLCATAARFPVRKELGRVIGPFSFAMSLALSGVPYQLRRQGVSMLLRSRVPAAGTAPWAFEEWERHDPAAVIQAGLALGRFDSREWIGGIDVPTAVIVTTMDTAVSPRRQAALAAAIPGAVAIEVAGAHRACVEDHRLFVPALVEACGIAGAGRDVPQARPQAGSRTV